MDGLDGLVGQSRSQPSVLVSFAKGSDRGKGWGDKREIILSLLSLTLSQNKLDQFSRKTNPPHSAHLLSLLIISYSAIRDSIEKLRSITQQMRK